MFPDKDASILCAMLLGDKEGLDTEIKELYQRNGIIHVLSISGLHISILGMGIYRLLRKMGAPVGVSALVGGVVLVLYGFLTGMSVSACRAIGMYLLHLLAKILGRTYDMQTAFGLLVTITLIYNPEYIFHQGFLLSYGAIAGIAMVYPALFEADEGDFRRKCELWVRRRDMERGYEAIRREHIRLRDLSERGNRNWRYCAEKGIVRILPTLVQSLGVSFSISLVTLPIQLWDFYEVPVYATFVNLLVLPFMDMVMVLGLIVMLIPGSGLLGSINLLVFAGCEQVCKWFGELPMHTWNPGRPEAWQMVVFYGCLLAAVKCRAVYEMLTRMLYGKNRNYGGKHRRLERFRTVRGTACKWAQICLIASGLLFLAVPEQPTNRVTFLDVGQGDGILVETASGQVYLFDCGSSSRNEVGEYVLLPYLKYRGIRQIDAVLISHGDEDHINGVEDLLQSADEEGISIGQLVVGKAEKAENAEKVKEGSGVSQQNLEMGSEFGEIAQVTAALGISCAYMYAGMEWQTEDATFTCLHPSVDYGGEGNEASSCFCVTFMNRRREETFSLLLTGDVEGTGEESLLEKLQRHNISEVSVLKVAHHGSKNSSSLELLASIRPKLAVISCGRNNRYGHPHEETLERLEAVGSRVMTTAESGAIVLEIEEEEILVSQWCD